MMGLMNNTTSQYSLYKSGKTFQALLKSFHHTEAFLTTYKIAIWNFSILQKQQVTTYNSYFVNERGNQNIKKTL